MSDSKRCIKCGDEKTLTCFYKNKYMGDGRVNICILCKVKAKEFKDAAPSEISLLLYRWASRTNEQNTDYN